VRESVDIRRGLAAVDPGRYGGGLAASLNSLGIRFREVGRYADALPVIQESVDIRRRLTDANPGRHRLGFVESLNKLSAVLLALVS
jgi:hypothetical protein